MYSARILTPDSLQVFYYVVDSQRNEGKDFFEINRQTGEIFTKVVFDREKQGAYALEIEARDGAPSARPNSHDSPNSGLFKCGHCRVILMCFCIEMSSNKTVITSSE